MYCISVILSTLVLKDRQLYFKVQWWHRGELEPWCRHWPRALGLEQLPLLTDYIIEEKNFFYIRFASKSTHAFSFDEERIANAKCARSLPVSKTMFSVLRLCPCLLICYGISRAAAQVRVAVRASDYQTQEVVGSMCAPVHFTVCKMGCFAL